LNAALAASYARLAWWYAALAVFAVVVSVIGTVFPSISPMKRVLDTNEYANSPKCKLFGVELAVDLRI
jgi:hypothetical protein